MSIATHEALAECVESDPSNFTERVKHAIHFKKFGFAITKKIKCVQICCVFHTLQILSLRLTTGFASLHL